MNRLLAFGIMFLAVAGSANAQTRAPVEAKSQITVLVDLSKTWLNDASKSMDENELRAVAQTVAAMLPKLKVPVEIRYFEIGDGSFSRPPLCQARYSPNIFHTTGNNQEFADIGLLTTYFGEDCSKLILLHRPALFTDITGALNTVSRIGALQNGSYSGLILLSDFKEERRKSQQGSVGSLKGLHSIMLYRVLDEDRQNPEILDARISKWQAILRRAGATVDSIDDVVIEPAQLKRLLLK